MDADATFEPDAPVCPAFKLTKTEMKTQRFLDFVQRVFREQPDVPAFKIIPPSDWNPTKTDIDVDSLVIGTPIQQLAFGKTGSYRALLVEQKAVTVGEYRQQANSEEKLPPPKCRKDYKLLERHFWKSVTINPPTYGADTPLSLFRPDCNGWGLTDIGDLLKEKDMPDIPGVTSPMTYFGMWKSFFAWHVEDADLYSVNFLHWGAPKIWYCVSPKDKAKFERLAGSLNPEQLRACKGFLRHKDVLISPTVLKQFGIQFKLILCEPAYVGDPLLFSHGCHVMQCKQNPGEYIVLNAAAYHSGFNCGFNTAEAVNFATEEWIETGKQAIPCTCTSMKDQVNIDMRMFEPGGLSVTSASDESDTEEHVGPCKGPEQRAGRHRDRDTTGRKRERGDSQGNTTKRGRGASEEPAPCVREGRQSCTSRAAAKPLRAAAMKLSAARKQHGQNTTLMSHLQKLNKPFAVVYGEEKKDKTPFDLVVPLETESNNKTKVMLQVLKLGKDGLYRPSSSVFEERRSSLVSIRTQLVDPGCRKPGFKLLTLTSRILDQTWV